MTRYLRTLALMAALAVFAVGTGTTAQEKKKDDKKPADAKKVEPKKDDKKPEPKKDEKKAEEKKDAGIQIYKNDNGRWRYRIVNAEGKTIVMPVPLASWDTKAECEKAIADLKALLNTAKPTEVKD
ncbi:MAG: hypothetical protein KF873_15675 [Gemmataceae bacterium]|nr:hypothetical protein [Gemmataceae bacterium]